MPKRTQRKRLLDAYRFDGFRPLEQLSGVFGDPKARVIKLARRSKKRSAVVVGARTEVGTIVRDAGYAICPVAATGFICNSKCGAWPAAAVAR
jgi:hypothetical protein